VLNTCLAIPVRALGAQDVSRELMPARDESIFGRSFFGKKADTKSLPHELRFSVRPIGAPTNNQYFLKPGFNEVGVQL
jgi:hypothetical protein